MADHEKWSKFFKMGKFNLKICQYRDEEFDEVFKLLHGSMTDSKGVGEGEFNRKQNFIDYLRVSVVALTIHDCDANQKIVGFVMYYPAQLSRSSSPLYLSAYSVTHKDYRGQGILFGMIHLADAAVMDLGYPAILSRMAFTARTPIPALKVGNLFLGLIPKALKIPKLGWVSDIISWRDLSVQMTRPQIDQFIARNRKVLSSSLKKNVMTTTLLPADGTVSTKTITLKSSETVTIKGANLEQVREVENMVAHCAQTGDGFGLDEFCPNDGHFLHKFIHEPRVVVATDSHCNVKAGAICGFSTLSRIPGSLYAAYFVVKRTERRKGIGSALLNVVTEMCKENNCDVMFFDVYANNEVAKAWLIKHGFLVTASVPHCGYVVNNGYTNSLLMARKLDSVTATNLVAKI